MESRHGVSGFLSAHEAGTAMGGETKEAKVMMSFRVLPALSGWMRMIKEGSLACPTRVLRGGDYFFECCKFISTLILVLEGGLRSINNIS